MIEGRSEVVVIGAGPAGAAAGITLARAGIDVTVLDRAQFPRPKTCGDALSNRAVATLDALGAGDRLRAEPHAVVRRAAAVFPTGDRVWRDYAEPGWIVPRLTLDDALRGALEDSGATLHQRCAVQSLAPAANGELRLTGDQVDWTSPLVIAADGPSSVAWPALSLGKPSGRALAVASTAYYRGVAFPEGTDVADHYFEADIPHGYAWIFPDVDGLANVGVYQRADRHRREGIRLSELLDRFIARHPERFTGATQQGRVRSWPLPIETRPRVAGEGIVLAGDAGGFVDPLSGEGIWQALFTGREAARLMTDAHANGGVSPALVRRYEAICGRAIGRPSRRKARVQEAMTFFVGRGLHRSRILRGVLQWGYARGTLELTKSV